MHHPMFFLYFSVFIALYVSINAYIFLHGYRMIGDFNISPIVYTIIFSWFASAYIIGEIVQRHHSSVFSDVLITFGSLWLVCIVHFFFVSMGFDIVKFTNYIFSFTTTQTLRNIAYHTTYITVIGTILIIMIGYINARSPIIREYTLVINKKNPITDTLRLAVASDIHL
jgi:hypothetical protein